eukprot:TRINITY_DN1762_c0_g1_i1.p1 TRINITY_DN1762_c0_g1~~TRINITY_DN1762_c0_g1_i1.p1  ORF type:complete len:187 (-),score=56.56 TRINITY_DN1762_c0_g1_i1:155-688(-)
MDDLLAEFTAELDQKLANFSQFSGENCKKEPVLEENENGKRTQIKSENVRKPKNVSSVKVKASTNPVIIKKMSKKAQYRHKGKEHWVDSSMLDWPSNDHRLFIGNLGNDVSEEYLKTLFSSFSSFQKTKLIHGKKGSRHGGYAFVSFLDPNDFLRAWDTFNGKHIGNNIVSIKRAKK